MKSTELVSFDTTMVLTQPGSWQTPIKSSTFVSIPLWFSRNRLLEQVPPGSPWFPYHYGSHATWSRPASRRLHCLSFPYHYGSHATRRYDHRVYGGNRFPYHYGSHATDYHVEILLKNRSSFHTTMVLTQQTKQQYDASEHNICFHTTMVLTQRAIGKHVLVGKNSFPYHYGSHATAFWYQIRNGPSHVSIPLWFSRNRFHYKIIIYDYGN